MDEQLANRLGDALIEVGNKFKAGTSELTEDEAMTVLSIVVHQPISREEVCDMANVNNTKFYELVGLKKIPAGRKRRGFKELYWYKDEVIKALNKLRHTR